MRQNLKLATQIALVSGTVCLAASCTTSSRVYAVVPTEKPSAAEIAQLTQLQQVDTGGQTVETAQIEFKPVDLATDKSIAMAYAIPLPKPANQAALAIQSVQVASADPAAVRTVTASPASIQVASADPEAAREIMVDPVVMQTRSIQPVVLQDGFDRPQISAATSLLNTRTDAADQPFVTSTKNTNLNQLITKYASLYDVPESLVHHVVRRETNYNPAAVHRGNWGLMQIRYNTAKGLGYSGSPSGLLDAETNLKFAVKYLKGAWIVADKDAKKADWLYRTGYYYQAKKKALLDDLGLQ